MTRLISAYVLTFLLAFTSLTLADARGGNSDIGMEVVICAGVSMTTIVIGPDGQPIETAHVCPDGASIFAADFTMPEMPLHEAHLLAEISPADPVIFTTSIELSPSARGPPALV